MTTIHDTPIADEGRYNTEMSKSLIDKIYFLDKVDASMFVDYGCADGAMLIFIEKVFPDIALVGYDVDEHMLETARANAMKANPASRIVFTSDWAEVRTIVTAEKANDRKVCLTLSSTLHEIHAYLSEGEQSRVRDEIWGRAGIVWDYVAFRDMMVSRTASRPSDPIQVTRIRQCFDRRLLEEWEATWGSIEENWSLVHLLLTYRYTHNWQRELKENYLPVAYEDFLAGIPAEYFPVYKDHFTLPFLRRAVRKSFGFDVNERTHLKLVLEHRPL